MTLDAAQQAVVAAPLGNLAVIAGPGSGKTATLVARIAKLRRSGELGANRSLALTHTTKAAGELRNRLNRAGVDGVTCSTVHAAAWRMVRTHWTNTGRSGEPQLQASTAGLVRAALRAVTGENPSSELVMDVASEIEWATARLERPGTYAAAARKAGRNPGISAKQIVAVWAEYRRQKQAAGILDFGDVVAVATDMCNGVGGSAVATTIDALFIDEYQDIDPAQEKLIEAWLGDGALCVIGDPEQCVYGFRAAEPSYLVNFGSRHSSAAVHHLRANWRSSPQIVDWVNRLASTKTDLVGMGANGPEPSIVATSDETAEEKALVTQIRAWRAAGIDAESIAVLYRFNATSARIEAALTDAGIPHHTAGSERFFDRPEVRAVLVPFGQAARANGDGDGVALLCDAAAGVGFDPLHPPAGAGAARARWEAQAALISLAADTYQGLSARWLLSELQERARNAHDLTPGGVTLATVHGAKGLEWDAVWVCGLVEGQMPSAFASTSAELAEERRITYVAASRARRELVWSWAKKRHNGWTSKPSRYLDLVGGSSKTTGPPRRRGPAATGGDRSTLPDGRRIGECERCGKRLTSAAARKSRRCGGTCLDGDAAGRYRELLAWTQTRSAELGISEAELVPPRTLFAVAVLGSGATLTGVHPDAGTIPFT